MHAASSGRRCVGLAPAAGRRPTSSTKDAALYMPYSQMDRSMLRTSPPGGVQDDLATFDGAARKRRVDSRANAPSVFGHSCRGTLESHGAKAPPRWPIDWIRTRGKRRIEEPCRVPAVASSCRPAVPTPSRLPLLVSSGEPGHTNLLRLRTCDAMAGVMHGCMAAAWLHGW